MTIGGKNIVSCRLRFLATFSVHTDLKPKSLFLGEIR